MIELRSFALMNFRALLLVCSTMAFLAACTTDFEVYAPEKEIRSVYCVLNPADSVQYVRVAKAFQFKGDALEYAGQNDLSMSGRIVKLTDGTKVWTAQEIPSSPRDSGIFIPFHTVYKFSTDGQGVGRDTLREGITYKLEIGANEDPDYLSAETTIPAIPKIKGELSIKPGAGNSRCLPRLSLDRKQNIYWTKEESDISYELRVGLEFTANNIPQATSIWGPTELFVSIRRCVEGTGNICYQFGEKELLTTFFADMPVMQNTTYRYVTTDSCVPQPTLLDLLPKSLWFEVTAVDGRLADYMNVNNPKFSDLTGAKPEYTNVTGKLEAVGVFGSYTTDRKYAIMSFCSEALLGLNGRPLPQGCSWD